jgi:hypothetical protein
MSQNSLSPHFTFQTLKLDTETHTHRKYKHSCDVAPAYDEIKQQLLDHNMQQGLW